MNKHVFLLASVLLLTVSGCAVKGDYTCGVPNNGVRCQPMNDTHEQLYNGSLSSLHVAPFPEDDESNKYDDENTEGSIFYADQSPSIQHKSAQRPSTLASIQTIASKQAILSQPREIRVWFDRFTDPDGDLHDESFMFIRLDNGHWVIDNKPVLY